eukprot:TRINITY_DN8212_c0_g1_i1.p2 TRINITY_DN8212_c0_g1~~TRINITY_DN8212_c0_g1_i1.p2  ORF type:complete len:318 (+),score=98.12 TRINITY_DN8212_c0_g1_i1:63-956(+)
MQCDAAVTHSYLREGGEVVIYAPVSLSRGHQVQARDEGDDFCGGAEPVLFCDSGTGALVEFTAAAGGGVDVVSGSFRTTAPLRVLTYAPPDVLRWPEQGGGCRLPTGRAAGDVLAALRRLAAHAGVAHNLPPATFDPPSPEPVPPEEPRELPGLAGCVADLVRRAESSQDTRPLSDNELAQLVRLPPKAAFEAGRLDGRGVPPLVIVKKLLAWNSDRGTCSARARPSFRSRPTPRTADCKRGNRRTGRSPPARPPPRRLPLQRSLSLSPRGRWGSAAAARAQPAQPQKRSPVRKRIS